MVRSGHEDSHGGAVRTATRRRLLKTALTGTALGTALTLAAGAPLTAADAAVSPAGCNDNKQDILDAILLAERLATTFYYTGLTTHAIVTPTATTPSSNGGRNGSLKHLAYVQQALAEEQQHAGLWQGAGATTPYGAFYFPAATFTRLGYTSQNGVFLSVLDYIETVLIGAYLAAIGRLGSLGHIDLAVMAVQILQTECTHRVLGRAIAGDHPADNVTLEVTAVACVGDAVVALQPFVDGRSFQGGATASIPLPSAAQVAQVVRRVNAP